MALLVGCGSDDGGGESLRPQLDQIAPAIDAVEAELGGPQEFFEITAEPQQVRLFVARDGATEVVPYVFIGGELAPAGAPTAAEGGTFPADSVNVDADSILDRVDAELDEPDVVSFSIAGDGTGAVQYVALVQSEEGGVVEVVLGPDGSIQSATGT